MRSLIVVLFFMPLLLFFVILTWRSLTEKTIARLSLVGALLNLSLSSILFGLYLQNGAKDLAFDLASLHWQDHHIDFNFFVDKLSLLNLLLSGFLFLVINRFSQSYLHRERGFARFFATINLFLFGFQLMSCAGTLDLFFAGWEIVGLCSFILIGFYFERTRVIKNAFRIFTIYRICDVGLLFSAILTHTLSSDSSHFLYFIHQDPSNVTSVLNPLGSLIVGLIILASLGKSAQFPFLNWPARAMEGPTPSSAVFYGALSIHGGVILIYRMLPLIEQFAWAQALIFGIGLVTIIFSSIIARTQSNIKGQLAYLSVRQVSIMMCELALGYKNLFLVHFALHTLYRCYQILVSPSVVIEHAKTLRQDTIGLSPKPLSPLMRRFKATLFIFSFMEGYISTSERGFFPLPLIKLKMIWNHHRTLVMSLLLAILSLAIWHFTAELRGRERFAHFIAVTDLLICLYCLSSYESPKKIWNYFIVAQVLFISANFVFDSHTLGGIQLYALSAIPLCLLGWWALRPFGTIKLTRFHGLSQKSRSHYYAFFIAFIGLSGYPFTSIFWAEDILFAETMLKAPLLVALTSLSLTLNGLICARLLIKTFWGFPEEQKI